MSSMPLHVTDHFITINDLNIHYRDWGDAHLPPLVILHGGGNSLSRTWDHIAAALADRFLILVPDLHWSGRPLLKSDVPRY
jgi:pimeloyl-ACP methyl ester carboxylesterase